MELCFEKKSTNIFAGRLHMVKSSAETVEAVVPDTNDDIARVASLQTMLLLKGKDISAHGITVTGEARAWLLYITEGGTVQSVTFHICGDLGPEEKIQSLDEGYGYLLGPEQTEKIKLVEA